MVPGMGVQRGSFQSGATSAHDAIFQRALQGSEVVTSAGFGALLMPMMRPMKGKVYVTSLRLAVVPDDQRIIPIWSRIWSDIDAVRVKKGFTGATAFVSLADDEVGVDSTKSIAGDIERAWLHLRNVALTTERTSVEFLPSVDVRCSSCDAQVGPGSPTCKLCLRDIAWPSPLDVIAKAHVDPDGLLPARYPDGSDTQRGSIISGLGVFAAAGICTGELAFVQEITRLLQAMANGERVPASTFADMPAIRGIGDAASNAGFWDLARQTPSRL